VETQFKNAIEPYVKKNTKLLLACSGGLDSVALFHLLKGAGIGFEVAHVNYHLRGEESNKDALFIQTLCETFTIPFHLKEVHIAAQDKSIQAEARNLRYHYFNDLKQQYGFDYIATAHHAGDKIENILFRFFRGTGLKGLLSLKILENDILRPLIAFDKEQLLTYLKTHHHPFREDESNAQSKYTRNKIRNIIIPALSKDLPNIEQRIIHTSNMLQADFSLIQTLLQKDKKLLEAQQLFNLDCTDEKFHEPSYWYYLLADENITTDEANNIATACKTKRNGFELNVNNFTVSVVKNHVGIFQNDRKDEGNIEKITQTTTAINLHYLKLTLSYFEGNEIINNPNTLCVDADCLAYPLIIRHPLPGDRFSPLGLEGSKLLSDFYNELAIAAHQKSKQWVLVDADKKIIAAFPQRIDNAVKVTEETKRVLVLCLEPF